MPDGFNKFLSYLGAALLLAGFILLFFAGIISAL